MGTIQIALVMAVMLALLVVPGLLVGIAARLPLRLALGASLPVSYGIASLASFAFGHWGIRWNLATFALASVAIAVLVGILTTIVIAISGGRAAAFPAPRARLPRFGWTLIPGLAVLLSAWFIGQMVITELSATTGGLSNIFQGWDAHWHVNYIEFISKTGQASPDMAGELRYPENSAALYYPSAWHAIAALVSTVSGAGAVYTYNLMQIGSLALSFPLGVAAIAWIMVHRRASSAMTATAAAAAALATPLLPGLPFVEIMVAATPSAAANGLAGLLAALVVGALANRRLIPVAALGLVGIGGVHPSAMVTAGAIVLFWWLFSALFSPVRSRLKDLATLVGIGAAGVLTLLPQVLSVSEDADSISAFEFQIDVDRAATWGKAVTLQVRHVQDWGIRWVVIAFAIVGLLELLRRKVVWPLLLWAGLVVVCVNAMSVFGNWTGGALRTVGSVYYNDPRRIGVILGVLVAATVGVGVAALAQGAAFALGKLMDPVTDPRGKAVRGAQIATALAACIGVSSWVVQASPEYAVAAGSSQRWGRLVDEHDLRAFNWLATQPKAYTGLIYTNPDEGSGWMYATNGLPSTARHYLQPEAPAPLTNYLFKRMDRAGIDASVDEALAKLGVTYVYISPPNYWGFQKPNRHLLDLNETPGLLNVYTDTQVRIFAVRAAFSPEELAQIQRDSPFPADRRTPLTRASTLYGQE